MKPYKKLVWIALACAAVLGARAGLSRGAACPSTPECPCSHAAEAR
jgi:hypothetical protein